mgnify:CR=1 FL=1
MFGSQGWSLATFFNEIDSEFGIKSLQTVLKMFEGINYNAITFMIKNCLFQHRTQDSQDKILLECLVDEIINDKVISVNRFRLSDSPHFFVPNKILYCAVTTTSIDKFCNS